jgi:hypothetical protein
MAYDFKDYVMVFERTPNALPIIDAFNLRNTKIKLYLLFVLHTWYLLTWLYDSRMHCHPKALQPSSPDETNNNECNMVGETIKIHEVNDSICFRTSTNCSFFIFFRDWGGNQSPSLVSFHLKSTIYSQVSTATGKEFMGAIAWLHIIFFAYVEEKNMTKWEE